MAFSSMVSIRGDEHQTLEALVEVQKLLDFRAMRTLEGFREARLLLAEDRGEAMMITEWETREHYQAWRKRPETESVIAHFVTWHPRITFFDVVAAVDLYSTE